MAETIQLVRHRYRWMLMLLSVLSLQAGAVYIGPQFICACGRPQWVPLGIMLAPLLWSIVLLTIRQGRDERAVAYGAFFLAIAFFFFVM